MADNKEDRLGLLFIFDCIAVILSTYGVILAFKIMKMDVSSDLMIISIFFIGVKALIMGIGDLTGVTRRFWLGGVFIIIADFIILMVEILMSFGISSRLLMVTMAVDLVLVCIGHIVWQKRFGIPIGDIKERKKWLNGSQKEAYHDGDEAMDDIFSSLNDEDNDILDTVASQELALPEDRFSAEDEGLSLDEADRQDADAILESMNYSSAPYEDSVEAMPRDTDSLYAQDESQSGQPEEPESDDEDDGIAFEGLDGLDFDTSPEDVPEDSPVSEEAPTAADHAVQPEPEASDFIDTGDLFEEDNDPSMFETETAQDTPQTDAWPKDNEQPKQRVTFGDIEPIKPVPQPTFFDEELITDNSDQKPQETERTQPVRDNAPQKTEDFTQLGSRLGNLVDDMGDDGISDGQFRYDVDAFRTELSQLEPITSDRDILKTGEALQEKLKNICDKQSIIEEVLDDMIRLSQQINSRIDNLDQIEAKLKQEQTRKPEQTKNSQSRDQLYVPASLISQEKAKVAVAPQEVILDSGDSEIIIDEEDLALIKAYMQSHPEA
ncbi:MAG: hypothetical protein PHI94_03385 [Eubacteriaceae bacterium]|nr:hypothetical protein [Eubacteriaceae bacterium]